MFVLLTVHVPSIGVFPNQKETAMGFFNAKSVVVAVMLMASGCVGSGQVANPTILSTPLQKLDAPDWVKKGSGAFEKNKGKVFYGVASATNIGNSSLLRTAADNRARNEIAKGIQVYSASLMKDYMASTSAGQESSDEQHVQQAIKTVTMQTLSGVEIIDHWQNPDTGELYSLAKLDLYIVKDAAEKSKELNDQIKEYVRKNADALHDQLEREESKSK